MPIHFACRVCGQKYRIAGHTTAAKTCIKCGETLNLPPPPVDEEIELTSEPTRKTKRKGSNYSYASLGFGLLGGVICAPLGLLAVILGLIALNSDRETGRKSNAIIGIVLGTIGCVLSLYVFANMKR